MQATAVPKDAAGNLLVGRTVAWSTSDANVAAVSTNGTVTGSGVGTATISATSEGTTGTASVTVLSRSLVSSLGLSLNVPAIQIGGVAQGTVTARDSVGDVVSGLPTTWLTSDASIASVSPTGAITGNAPGTVTISATVEGKTATATLRVASLSVASVTVVVAPDLAVGASTAATTILRDRDGNALNDRVVTWTVSNPVIANISTTTGVLTGLTAGYVIVTATSEDQTGNALVHVGTTGTVGGGGATLLGLVTQPSSSVQSGAVFGSQPSVQIRDGSNNPFSQSGVVVVAAIASGSGSLSGTTTATTDASGLATFTNLKITGPVGARTLSFSATALAPAISGTINVTAGAAAQITVSSQPSASAQSGVAFGAQPAVQIRDVSGNAVGQAGVVVTASIATGTGTLGGTTTATTNASGVAAFTNLSITGTGANTLRFAATGLTSVTSSTISLGAGAPAILTITTQPSSSSASGASFAQQPAVQLRDASNNAVSQSGVVVTATIATGGGTLGGTTTATTSSSGVATFTNLSITGAAGARTLSFDAASLTGATSGTITLTAGAAAQLAVATQPSSAAQSGTAFSAQPAIRLQDAVGNSVSQSGVVVTASIATGTGTLAGTLTATTNASGVATFTNLGITGSGAYTLQFVAAGLAAITSGTINVSAAAVATQVTLATQPSSAATSGVAFSQQPVIQLRDGSNNAIAQSGVAVTASIATGSGTLSGTLTATTNSSGVATFTNLGLTGAGAFTLRFVAASLTAITSSTITVGATVASRLAVSIQPSATAVSGAVLAQQPSIQIQDASGNPVGQSGVVVTANVSSGIGTLGGTTSATTNGSGVAAFSNLSITGSGTVTLAFNAPSLSAASSSAIALSVGSGGGTATPLMTLNWSNYASTSAFYADCTTFQCSNDHFGNGDVVIDPSVHAPDGTNTLRYHYNHGSGTGCNSITLGRDFYFPGGQQVQEAWGEFQVKWSTNFTTGGQVPAHSCDPNDHKLIFGLPASQSGLAGRWAFYVGADSDPYHNLNQERPYPLWGGAYLNGTGVPSSESLWQSGTWHTIRLHIKNSTTATSNDGVWEIWLDGRLIHQQTGFSVHDDPAYGAGGPLKLKGFSIGRNKDDGPPNVDMYLWWGRVTVFAANPGW